MKKIPNILTAARIVLAAALIFTGPFGTAFLIVYILCGLTDVLDGFAARRLNAESRLGAVLDSVADMVFFGTAAVKLLPILHSTLSETVFSSSKKNAASDGSETAWIFIVSVILAVAAVRISSAIIGAKRLGKPVFYHTYTNKAAGAALFALPFTVMLFGAAAVFLTVAVSACASVDELLIAVFTDKTNKTDVNVRFIGDIFMSKKKREHIVFDRTRDKKPTIPFAEVNKKTVKRPEKPFGHDSGKPTQE